MRILAVAVILAACSDQPRPVGPASSECESWRQWGSNPAHGGASCVTGQPLRTALSSTVYDPFLAREIDDAGGVLLVHYPAPLIDGDDLYMMTKRGTYTPCTVGDSGPSCLDPDELHRLDSQIWTEQRFAVSPSGVPDLQWSFDSDWKPEPGVRFEPMFQPALAGELIAIPGAGGALWELDRGSGHVVRHVQPLGAATDPDTYVAGGLAVGADGTIYYNALKLDHDQPFVRPSQAWLVAVAPDGTARTADYTALVPGAPAAGDPCFGTYDPMTALPWPPANSDGSLVAPPAAPCGPQRPGINTTPAVGADGTIFVVSRAHANPRYAYLAAVGPDLQPRWASSLRDVLHDDCGVSTPSDATATDQTSDCRTGTPDGVERVTGLAPAGRVDDQSSSSPVALPDGGVLYGAFTGYNSSRGHLFKLDRTGALAATFDFGWDSTPAVFGGPDDYKIVIKDNHYGTDAAGVDTGPFYITELDAQLHIVWQFQSTNTKSCARQPDGTIACIDDHPHGFEWCINAPAVDRDGTVYANSEDGTTYAIAADGTLRDALFLDQALGAAYTPVALDHRGRVFALNGGRLTVLGR
ncbi:MAG TPA: hypothetical protein VHW23_46810 [Kofleriaceae bacterium]|nr:hypothetical protein [Kofleriaceae bacterium]